MATSIATFQAILKFCATKNLFKQICILFFVVYILLNCTCVAYYYFSLQNGSRRLPLSLPLSKFKCQADNLSSKGLHLMFYVHSWKLTKVT